MTHGPVSKVRFTAAVAISCLCFAITACGGRGSLGKAEETVSAASSLSPSPTAEASPSAAPLPTEEAPQVTPEAEESPVIRTFGSPEGSSVVSVQIKNDSGKGITGIAIKTGEGQDYGEDLLSGDDSIAEGESFVVHYDTEDVRKASDEPQDDASYDSEDKVPEYLIRITYDDGECYELHSFPFGDTSEAVLMCADGFSYIMYTSGTDMSEVSTEELERMLSADALVSVAAGGTEESQAADGSAGTEVYTEPVYETYTEPVQETFAEPAQETYTEPAQEMYTEPVQETYTEPVQETYAEPVQEISEQPAQEVYVQPVQEVPSVPAADPNAGCLGGDAMTY